MGLPDKIADFTVVPLLYGQSTQHILYIKEHISKPGSGKAALLPNGRTLFLVNIPPDATERELTLLFKSCGHVERVIVQSRTWSPEAYEPLEISQGEDEDEVLEAKEEAAVAGNSEDSAHRRKRRKLSMKKNKSKGPPPQVVALPQPELSLRTLLHSGSSAHLVFTDTISIPRALELGSASSKIRTWPPTTGTVSPWGLAHYAALYEAQRPSLQDVKAHADSFLQVYEYNKALTKQKSEYKKGVAIVDEDGFTLVTRGGAYGTTLGGGVGVATKQFMEELRTGEKATSSKRGKKKPKKHEKDNFYKFQSHEKKRKELVDLKDEFEKDKKAIARLGESRRFKPY
ncbi:ribosomal RNA-processing protein 7-domain-containing protein [Gautieria morchelliformis]|nr:ribosomal RNA-processing protein 7-domain-containing protein [Gautieria morchelliformis]